MNKIIELFLTFLKIGSFSIGGGYAIIPHIQNNIVISKNWLTITEFTDIITISQMTPGPLVVNSASFVGIRVAGTIGAIAATIGSLIFGIILSIVLYNFFNRNKGVKSVDNILKGLRSSSAGLIASATMTIMLITFKQTNTLKFNFFNLNTIAILISLISLYCLRKYKINPLLVIVVTGCLGLVIY